MAIAGFCIGGIAFGSQALFLTVVSEVLPRKYRSYGQAAANGSVALGSIFSLCVGGSLTQNNPAGFRTYFYITAGIYAGATILCALLYNSPPRELQVVLTTREKLRSLDSIGYAFLTAGCVLLCLGLSWAQNPYAWDDAHVLAPFLLGIFFLVCLIVYAWKFKDDGLLHHALFRDRNFPIALIAVFIEGMAFMAANVYFPYSLSVLQATTMGAFRQALCYNIAFCTFAVAALVAGFYIYKTRTVRIPGMLTFASFIVFFAMMASVTATTHQAFFWGTIIFYGLGLGLCLVTFVTAAQFSTPPELIAITSGLVLSMRSLGGSIGVAIFNAIFAHGLSSNLVPKVTAAVTPLGLSSKEIGPLIGALSAGNITLAESLPGVNLKIIGAAGLAMDQAYVIGFRDVFVCGGCFSVVALFSEFEPMLYRVYRSFADFCEQLPHFYIIQAPSSMRRLTLHLRSSLRMVTLRRNWPANNASRIGRSRCRLQGTRSSNWPFR